MKLGYLTAPLSEFYSSEFVRGEIRLWNITEIPQAKTGESGARWDEIDTYERHIEGTRDFP